MTRVVSVGRSKGLFALAGTGFALLIFGTTGCPGTLDPSEFPPPVTGTGGTSGGGGTTGTAGTGGGMVGCATVAKVFEDHSCALTGSCHDAMGSAAGFKMAGTGWETMLVGVTPKGGGALASMCMGNTMPYIIKGPPPVGGLIMNKLMNKTPACGAQMPNLPPTLNATEMACVQAWANALGAP